MLQKTSHAAYYLHATVHCASTVLPAYVCVSVCLYVCAMAALHQSAPGQMTWLEDPPPWLRPAYYFISVIVWTKKIKTMLAYLTVLFVLIWQWNNNQRRWRLCFFLGGGRRLKTEKKVNFLRKKVHPATWLEVFLTSKWPGSFTALAFAPDGLPHDLSDLEMTWLPWRPGAATVSVCLCKN